MFAVYSISWLSKGNDTFIFVRERLLKYAYKQPS